MQPRPQWVNSHGTASINSVNGPYYPANMGSMVAIPIMFPQNVSSNTPANIHPLHNEYKTNSSTLPYEYPSQTQPTYFQPISPRTVNSPNSYNNKHNITNNSNSNSYNNNNNNNNNVHNNGHASNKELKNIYSKKIFNNKDTR